MLIFVGWLPPCSCPSGACLGLGTRICRSLITVTRVAPSPGLRLLPWSMSLLGRCSSVVSGLPRYAGSGCHLGDRPHEARELPGGGRGYRVRMLAPGEPPPLQFAHQRIDVAPPCPDGTQRHGRRALLAGVGDGDRILVDVEADMQ